MIKKTLSLFMIALLICTITACSKKETDKSESDTSITNSNTNIVSRDEVNLRNNVTKPTIDEEGYVHDDNDNIIGQVDEDNDILDEKGVIIGVVDNETEEIIMSDRYSNPNTPTESTTTGDNAESNSNSKKISNINPEKQAIEKSQTQIDDSGAIIWTDSALEELIRLYIGKTNGEAVYPSDFNDITAIRIISDVDFSGGSFATENTRYTLEITDYTDIKYTITENPNAGTSAESYAGRGAIKSLADLVHFSKLKNIAVYFTSVTDITPLLNIETLEEITLVGNLITNIDSLFDLPVLTTLDVSYNNIQTIKDYSDTDIAVTLTGNPVA